MEPSADELMRSYGAAWERGDVAGAFAHYADDVVMRIPGHSPAAGEHRGKEAVVACIRSLLSQTEGVEVEVIDRLVGTEHVVMLVRERARRVDQMLDIRRANAYRVSGGKIVEIDIYEGDQYQVDDFFRGGS